MTDTLPHADDRPATPLGTVEALTHECDLADQQLRKWVRVPTKYLREVLQTVHDLHEAATSRTDAPAPCEMTHTAPYDFAVCTTHDETFPLGDTCKFFGRTSVAEVYADEADQQRARAVTAEMREESLRETLALAGPHASRADVVRVINGHRWAGTKGRSHDDPGGIRWACECGFEQNIAGMSGISSWLDAHAEHAADEVVGALAEATKSTDAQGLVKPAKEDLLDALLAARWHHKTNKRWEDLSAADRATFRDATGLEPLADAVYDILPGRARIDVEAAALEAAADAIEEWARRATARVTENVLYEEGASHLLREYAQHLRERGSFAPRPREGEEA